jgi:tetratricopeptide (TPR) repeat protein
MHCFPLQTLKRLVCLAMLFAMSACGLTQPYERTGSTLPPEQPNSTLSTVQTQPAPSPEVAPAEPLPAPTPRPKTLSPATRALVNQAQAQLNAGNQSLASSTIERALRIESDNPLLWIELAKIRHHEGNDAQAENLAKKALAMASGDNKAQAAAWRVIADSYRARGRNPEAREAQAKAAAFGG